MATVILPPMLFPPVGYYEAVAKADKVLIDTTLRYDKRRKAMHRYDIADTRGRLALTVPVIKPHGIDKATWADTGISSHGRWWHVHRVTLESAYGRTPYFEFLIDKFDSIFREPVEGDNVAAMAIRADRIIRQILQLETPVITLVNSPTDVSSAENIAAEDSTVINLIDNDFKDSSISSYRQVRADSLGYIGGLSILDFIFNLGPEGSLLLD